MSLIGPCDDCGKHRPLQYKPAVPLEDQTRPSVCSRCKYRREEVAEQHAQSMGVRR